MNILEKDKRYCWHPFTQHQTERDPIVITKAKGACLYDEQGAEILDLISSWWTCTHGHAHPALNEALASQANTMDDISNNVSGSVVKSHSELFLPDHFRRHVEAVKPKKNLEDRRIPGCSQKGVLLRLPILRAENTLDKSTGVEQCE